MNTKRHTASLLLGVVLAACANIPNSPTPAGPSGAPTPAVPSGAVVVEPTPAPTTAPPTAAPTATPTPAPSAPAPTSTPKPAPPASLPVAGAGVGSMVPQPDGGLYVSISAAGGTVLASLDAAGRLRPGGSVVLAGLGGCEIASDPVAVAAVWAVCIADSPAGARAFAYDDTGRLLPGWPVDLPGGTVDERRVVDGHLYVVTRRYDTSRTDPHVRTLVRVSPEGAVRTVANLWGLVEGDHQAWWIGQVAIGPDGTAYAMAYSDDSATQVIAVDLGGVRPGWPIRIDGYASRPAFGPDGRIYMTVGVLGSSSSQVLAFTRDGRAIPGWPAELPVAAPADWDGAGAIFTTSAPVVASDGSAYVVAEEGEYPSIGTTAYAIDSSGGLAKSWPFRTSTGLVWLGDCRCATGCGRSRSDQVAGPDGSLYLLQVARGAGTGGSILAVGKDGAVKAGWPVVLRRAGAEFSSVVVGPDGTAFALAIEPARYVPDECGGTVSLDSATILAINPDGTVRYRVTVAEP